MKKRRIFIAVDLPDQIKKKLASFQKKWSHLPVRWTNQDNLHLTIVFIGYVTDDEVLEICHLAKQAASKQFPFEINFERICLGPPIKSDGWPTRPPRMIWLEGAKSSGLVQLKSGLEEALFDLNRNEFNHYQNKAFNPHITLARIKQSQWQELAQRPEIDRSISFTVPIEQIKIMESELSRTGPQYVVLETIQLGI